MEKEPQVYLIHLDKPIAHARHYVGWSDDLPRRLRKHRRGKGSRLLQVAIERGIGWKLVRTWFGSRELERRIKRWHGSDQLCPVCCRTALSRITHEVTGNGQEQR